MADTQVPASPDKKTEAQVKDLRGAKPAAGETREVIVSGRVVGQPDQEETETYRLKPGYKHFSDGRFVDTGEEVELNERQAAAFRDKFEKVSTDRKAAAAAVAPPEKVTQGTSHTPQDIGSKQANETDLNPGNQLPISSLNQRVNR